MSSLFEIMNKSYFDLTGELPCMASRGHRCIFVLYDYDSNAILTAVMKNRLAEEHVRAYKETTQHLTNAGLHPQFQILDNECSEELKQCISDAEVEFQLALQHIY